MKGIFAVFSLLFAFTASASELKILDEKTKEWIRLAAREPCGKIIKLEESRAATAIYAAKLLTDKDRFQVMSQDEKQDEFNQIVEVCQLFPDMTLTDITQLLER